MNFSPRLPFLLLAFAAPLSAQLPDVVPGQVLVKLRPDAGAGFHAAVAEHFDTIGAGSDVEMRRAFPHLNAAKINRVGMDRIHVLTVPTGTERLFAEELAALELVEWAQANELDGGITGGGAIIPNDPSFPDQWHLDQASDIDMDVPEAWAKRGTTQADGDLIVAVLDTGYDTWTDQADWDGILWKNPLEVRDGIDQDGNGLIDDVNGWDYDEDDWVPQAVHPHGVNTGGEIAAIADNGEQVAGVASGVQVMVVKIFNPSGNWPSSGPYAGELAGATGILYATDQGAHITNNSWFNGDTPSLVINDAIDYAVDNGVHMIFAAANCGDTTAWPAENPKVTAVAAIDRNGLRSVWGFQASNYGPWVDVSAGGTDIATTENLGGVTTSFAGTSAACPLVVGVGCIALSEDPDLGNEDLREVLMESAVDIDALNPGFEGLLGSGHVNALATLELLENHANVGNGLAGDFAPILNTWGRTSGGGEEITLSVHAAAPSAPSIVVFGLSEANLPFFGGTLVPSVDFLSFGTTTTGGDLHLEFNPAGALPSGPAVWAQVIVLDAGAPQSLSLSNAQVLSGN